MRALLELAKGRALCFPGLGIKYPAAKFMTEINAIVRRAFDGSVLGAAFVLFVLGCSFLPPHVQQSPIRWRSERGQVYCVMVFGVDVLCFVFCFLGLLSAK